MARPKGSNNANLTRSTILQAARLEFAERGMSAPLDAIAKRCDMRRPSLLHHFPSKKVLIEAAIEDSLVKAKTQLLAAMAAGKGDYNHTMRSVLTVLRDLEKDEIGLAGMLLHALLSPDHNASVNARLAEFIEVIHATALMAGADQGRSVEGLRAAITHLVMGEIVKEALGDSAKALWGSADGVNVLFDAYFLNAHSHS